MSQGTLQGRVAIVTGAGQGSGRGCALALAAEGAAVTLVGRTVSKLEGVAAEIRGSGGCAQVTSCDVTQPDQIDRAVESTVAEFGGVHILVNAAQSPILRSSSLLETPPEMTEQLWQSGPRATLDFMRACHPHLRGGGSIINFGTGAQFGPGNYGVYAAAKAAIGMLTRAAAEEWGPDGIRANLLVPFADSPAADAELEHQPAFKQALLESIPLRRFGHSVSDVGRVAVFLAGPDSAFVTGTTLMVDGGMKFLR
jgi:NAD(P)-dependent dehydrogenase (short-subunit alcohol dehydrogenase family)